jgi:hypothetical protein
LKVTVPLGVAPLPLTVAVNVTEVPNVVGLLEAPTPVELEVGLTACVSAGEVLLEKLTSPP